MYFVLFLPVIILAICFSSFGCCSSEGYQTSFMSGTFLIEDSPYYFCMLEILLGKLTKPLFIQVCIPAKMLLQFHLIRRLNFPSCIWFLLFSICSPLRELPSLLMQISSLVQLQKLDFFVVPVFIHILRRLHSSF
jgi:hypothetical protein